MCMVYYFILQIEAFRELRSVHGKITHNFRPIQPIGDRVVFYNIDNNYFVYNEIDDPDATTAKPSRKKKWRNNGQQTLNSNNYSYLVTLVILLRFA